MGDFGSLLYERPQEIASAELTREPEFFADLNIDQIINDMVTGKEHYNLKPCFYLPLRDVDTVYYRHEVARDLENPVLFDGVKGFSDEMQKVRRYLAMVEKLDYSYNKEGWFLEAVDTYCSALALLKEKLCAVELNSKGLRAFRDYLNAYMSSDSFAALREGMQRLKQRLSDISYCVLINGGRVTVCRYEGEDEYIPEVERVFQKFKDGSTKEYSMKMLPRVGMNHVEAEIVKGVVRFYPDVFGELSSYYERNLDFIDEKVERFDREVQFYVSYFDYINALRKRGLEFCYPEVSADSKEVYLYEGFDMALARMSIRRGSGVVCNSFYLRNGERVIVVTGPNQGGKTTFARMFGQVHYFASLGLPVAGRKAKLFLPDGIFTHFERKEDITDLRGKLEDDLVRMRDILQRIDSGSIVVINEIFSSTSTVDAVFLAKKVLEKIIQMDAIAVCVTFLDELASLNRKVVSMVATVDPDDPTIRTYRVVRNAADGRAYAVSIAQKYHLTYRQLRERLKL